MNKSYQPRTRDQAYLLPPSLRDWLQEDHLAWFILSDDITRSAVRRAECSRNPVANLAETRYDILW